MGKLALLPHRLSPDTNLPPDSTPALKGKHNACGMTFHRQTAEQYTNSIILKLWMLLKI